MSSLLLQEDGPTVCASCEREARGQEEEEDDICGDPLVYATFVAPIQQYSTETEPSRQPSFNSRQPSFNSRQPSENSRQPSENSRQPSENSRQSQTSENSRQPSFRQNSGDGEPGVEVRRKKNEEHTEYFVNKYQYTTHCKFKCYSLDTGV
jgi:hypothetical protein